MFHRVINNIFKIKRKEISEVIYDIDLFYNYLRQNKYVVDEWYFNNVLTIDYRRYLKNFNWMKQDELSYLHQGVLNLILFKLYFLCEKPDSVLYPSRSLARALNNFESINPKTNKLLNLAKKTLIILEQKQENNTDTPFNPEIYESIKWTTQNILESNKPSRINK